MPNGEVIARPFLTINKRLHGVKMLLGNLKKMRVTLKTPVQYELILGEHIIPLNDLIGRQVTLCYQGEIHCIHCGRKTKKSFNQGYCYPCTQKLAECDICIVRPEKCHFAQGTCRDNEWAEMNCFIPHIVYLANTSGLKVGITRGTQIPTRWIDQGATQALPIFKTVTRFQVGLIEKALSTFVADKTNWRNMLKGNAENVDLKAEGEKLIAKANESITKITKENEVGAIIPFTETASVEISYPVLQFPQKIVSHNFDKNSEVCGVLKGIKGQYLIFDSGVINIRKFAGYMVSLA